MASCGMSPPDGGDGRLCWWSHLSGLSLSLPIPHPLISNSLKSFHPNFGGLWRIQECSVLFSCITLLLLVLCTALCKKIWDIPCLHFRSMWSNSLCIIPIFHYVLHSKRWIEYEESQAVSILLCMGAKRTVRLDILTIPKPYCIDGIRSLQNLI